MEEEEGEEDWGWQEVGGGGSAAVDSVEAVVVVATLAEARGELAVMGEMEGNALWDKTRSF